MAASRYCILTDDILELVAVGVVTPADAFLLAIIDGFVRNGPRGCYATNAYLAKRTAVDERNVRKRLARLGELGLVVKTTQENVRYLRTDWGAAERLLDEHQTPPPAPKNAVGVNARPPGRKRPPPLGVNAHQKSKAKVSQVKQNKVSPDGDGGGFGFATTNATATPGNGSTTTERDIGWAKKLRGIVRRRLGRGRRVNLDVWANSFRLLRTDVDDNVARIHKVLKWYATNMDGEFTPVVESANTFRKKFLRIEQAMQRAATKKTPAPAGVAITPGVIAKSIVRRLGTVEGTGLAAAVQLSLDNYAAMRARWSAALEHWQQIRNATVPHQHSIPETHLRLMLEHIPTTDAAIDEYWVALVPGIGTWQGFDGNWLRFAWNEENDKWKYKMQRLARYVYDGDLAECEQHIIEVAKYENKIA